MEIPQQVFESTARGDASYASHSEPIATFLGRAAGEYWNEVRELIERWVLHLPQSGRSDLIGRLRSPLNRQFGAAFWELYLHESFLRSGFEVEIHPTVPTRSRQPDFRVTRGTEAYYIEATAMFGASDGGEQARLSQLYDEINKIHSPNFFLSLTVTAVGPQALPTKRLKLSLANWLAQLNPDELDATAVLLDPKSAFIWRESGWQLEFHPMPVRAEFRSLGHQPLGMFSVSQQGRSRKQESIREALSDKGSAYGLLDLPLIIAVNLSTGFNRDFETMNALFGSAGVRISHADLSTRDVRGLDGYWGSRGRWRHGHVCGVLIGPNISPFNVARVSPTYWLHPSPRDQIRPLEGWRTAALIGDQVEQVDPQVPIYKVLKLPENWPPGEPFSR